MPESRQSLQSRPFRGFRPQALRFLRQLRRHNTREWFQAHRTTYEAELLEPMRRLVEEVDLGLAGLAPELSGDPRRSIFRIHRDVRFSKDKSPYKTTCAAQFFHRSAGRYSRTDDSQGAAAGLYVQVGPGESFAAAGLWMPPRQPLAAVREGLAEQWATFARIVQAPAFRRAWGALDDDGRLTRVPRGFAPDHPAAAWLRYRSFTVTRPLTDAEVLDPRLVRRLLVRFRHAVPFVRWINAALGLPAGGARF